MTAELSVTYISAPLAGLTSSAQRFQHAVTWFFSDTRADNHSVFHDDSPPLGWDSRDGLLAAHGSFGHKVHVGLAGRGINCITFVLSLVIRIKSFQYGYELVHIGEFTIHGGEPNVGNFIDFLRQPITYRPMSEALTSLSTASAKCCSTRVMSASIWFAVTGLFRQAI